MLPAKASLFGRGLYTLADLSRLANVPSRSIVRWTQGYDYRYRGRLFHSPGIIGTRIAPIEGQRVFEFLDLMEIRFLYAFRQHGVSLQVIRQAAATAREILKESHPFSTRKFQTDGRSVFLEMQRAGERGTHLLDLAKRQYALREILQGYLYRGIVYDEEGRPDRWYPVEGSKIVVVDPDRAFGSPIIDRRRIQTRVLYLSYKGEGSVARVAWAYEITEREVQAAVDFESKLAA